MIKIGDEIYYAEQVVMVQRENEIPVQPVEVGFDVQDHIRNSPLQARIELVIFNSSRLLNARKVSTITRTFAHGDYSGTFQYLQDLHNSGEMVMLDCSAHQGNSSMIYPNMVVTNLGQVVQMGGTYHCTVMFTQITQTKITKTDLYVQDSQQIDPVTGEVVQTVIWSKDPVEPTTTEELVLLDESEDRPFNPLKWGILGTPLVAAVSDVMPDLTWEGLKEGDDNISRALGNVLYWAFGTITGGPTKDPREY